MYNCIFVYLYICIDYSGSSRCCVRACEVGGTLVLGMLCTRCSLFFLLFLFLFLFGFFGFGFGFGFGGGKGKEKGKGKKGKGKGKKGKRKTLTMDGL